MKTAIAKFESKSAKVAIVGMGYVGLPLARRCLEVGFTIYGIEVSDAKVSKLRDGETYIRHISNDDIRKMNKTGRFFPTTDFKMISQSDAVVICVPTALVHQQ